MEPTTPITARGRLVSVNQPVEIAGVAVAPGELVVLMNCPEETGRGLNPDPSGTRNKGCRPYTVWARGLGSSRSKSLGQTGNKGGLVALATYTCSSHPGIYHSSTFSAASQSQKCSHRMGRNLGGSQELAAFWETLGRIGKDPSAPFPGKRKTQGARLRGTW